MERQTSARVLISKPGKIEKKNHHSNNQTKEKRGGGGGGKRVWKVKKMRRVEWQSVRQTTVLWGWLWVDVAMVAASFQTFELSKSGRATQRVTEAGGGKTRDPDAEEGGGGWEAARRGKEGNAAVKETKKKGKQKKKGKGGYQIPSVPTHLRGVEFVFADDLD